MLGTLTFSAISTETVSAGINTIRKATVVLRDRAFMIGIKSISTITAKLITTNSTLYVPLISGSFRSFAVTKTINGISISKMTQKTGAKT
jgi:hypothetical protein